MKRLILLVILSSAVAFSSAQEWNYARLSVIYGGNIPFNFNSIQRYSNGIEITDGTILGITLADSGQIGHTLEGFDLNFRAFNAAAVIQGDAYTLSLDKIRIKAENYLGLVGGISSGYNELSSGWKTLYSFNNPVFTSLSWDQDQLSISFECGKPVSAGGTGSLLGTPPDYYTVEVEFELVPTGPGF